MTELVHNQMADKQWRHLQRKALKKPPRATKRKAAPPPKQERRPHRIAHLSVRMTPEDKREIQHAAAAYPGGLSAYVRAAVLAFRDSGSQP